MADNQLFFGGRSVGAHSVKAEVTFVDNSKNVEAQMSSNISRALDALGVEAVGMIVKQMEKGYGKPIRLTGNLMRDVQYHASINNKEVAVGNTLSYAPFVHDGTIKMRKREYITDALTRSDNKQRLKQVASVYLSKGFEK